jgi:L-ascorbate metabolism protein UlaG (beta-lactamase superfamily)
MMRKIRLTLLLIFAAMLRVAAQETFVTDTFFTKSNKPLIIHAIKHGSLRICFDGKEIEVDPVSGLSPATNYKDLPQADYILVTHEHGDHLDKTAIADLEKSTTVLVTNENSAKILGRGTVMRNGDSLQLEPGMMLWAVPAYNITPGHLQYHLKGRDNGYVLDIDGLRVYIAGDTEDIDEMSGLGAIDIAFLPTNQPYTMTPEQTARAARRIRPKVLFPYHYGNTPVAKVAELLGDTDIEVRIRPYQ